VKTILPAVTRTEIRTAEVTMMTTLTVGSPQQEPHEEAEKLSAAAPQLHDLTQAATARRRRLPLGGLGVAAIGVSHLDLKQKEVQRS
jgi:hypothetical protein